MSSEAKEKIETLTSAISQSKSRNMVMLHLER